MLLAPPYGEISLLADRFPTAAAYISPKIAAELARKFQPFANIASLVRLKNNPYFQKRLDEIVQSLATILTETLDFETLAALRDFYKSNEPFILLKNLPLGPINATPSTIKSITPSLAEYISLGMLGLNKRKTESLLIGNVILKEDDKEMIRSANSGFEPFHSHSDMADYGVLYCLRGFESVCSFITSSYLIEKYAPPEIIRILTTPYHYHGKDKPAQALFEWKSLPSGEKSLAFGKIFVGSENFHLKLLELSNPKPWFKFRPAAAEAYKALAWLYENSKRVTTAVMYKPGDLIIINQQTTLRGIFARDLKSSETKERWLISTTAKLTDERQPSENLGTADICALLRCASLINPSIYRRQRAPHR